MKNIFITGSEGFIGSHLVESLVKSNHNVRALVQYNSFNSYGWLDTIDKKIQKEIEINLGDIRDYDSIKNAAKKSDYIIHLASLIAIPYSYISPESYVNTNINGTLNVLKLGRELGIKKFIHTSTSEVYGSAQFVPMTEDHPVVGQSPYSASKIAADQLAISFQKSFNLPLTILRPFNTFGPRQSNRAVIPTIINQLLSNKKIINLGSTFPTRDFTYVSDTVSGFIKCLNFNDNNAQTINIASNFEISIKSVFNLICKLMNKKASIKEISLRKRPNNSEVTRLFASNSKAKKLLKWNIKYSGKNGFEKGLVKTIDWFSNNKNSKYYKSNKYTL